MNLFDLSCVCRHSVPVSAARCAQIEAAFESERWIVLHAGVVDSDKIILPTGCVVSIYEPGADDRVSYLWGKRLGGPHG